MRHGVLFAGLFLLFGLAGGCGEASGPPKASRIMPPEEVPAVIPPPARVQEALPFPDERATVEAMYAEAQPLGAAYPADWRSAVRLDEASSSLISSGLGIALYQGNLQQVKDYLAAGATLNEALWFKPIPLSDVLLARSSAAHLAINAVYMGHAGESFLSEVLALGVDSNALVTEFMQDADGIIQVSSATVLHHAVTSAKPELVERVLAQGVADVNLGAETASGSVSPLFTAVVRGEIEMVRSLLDAGADVGRGSTPKVTGGVAHTSAEMAETMAARKPGMEGETARAIAGLLRERGISASKAPAGSTQQ